MRACHNGSPNHSDSSLSFRIKNKQVYQILEFDTPAYFSKPSKVELIQQEYQTKRYVFEFKSCFMFQDIHRHITGINTYKPVV